MTPPAVGLGTLARLSAIDARSTPVLSVYLDLDPACPKATLAAFDALLGSLARAPGRRDCERVRSTLATLPCPAHGTRSIALFATAGGCAHAVVPLPLSVHPMIVVDGIPWLEPIAGMLTSGDRGAAVLHHGALRLMRGGQAALVQFAAVPPASPRSSSRASSSTAPGASDETALEQIERLGGMLRRAHARRPFERLALAAQREHFQPLERALGDELRGLLIGEIVLEEHLADDALHAVLLDVLAHERDGRDLRCQRATATALPGGGPAIVSQTSTRLARPLPEAAPAAAPEPSQRELRVSRV